MDVPFRTLRSAWRSMIDLALKAKMPFQIDSDECMRFFNGPYDFLYGMGGQKGEHLYTGMKRLPRPSIAMTVNKVAEGVQLFGPALYHRNPVCNVWPRQIPPIPIQSLMNPNDPNAQMQFQQMMMEMSHQQQGDAMRATLLEAYLNYLPNSIQLEKNSRRCIDEAIIKGAGVLWSEMDAPAGGGKMPRLVYDTCDNLVIDPDHETLEEAHWVARRFIRPVWEVETERGLEPGTLRGNYDSYSKFAAVAAVGEEYQKRIGKTNDLIVYWGVWSKMGLGGLLRGIGKEASEGDRFGQYVYFEVCAGYEYFLNCPPSIWENEDEMYRRFQWETPFWADTPSSNGWPFVFMTFHEVPRSLWPMSHFRPGLGELKFINWAYSFLISAIQKRCRDFILTGKGIDEEVKQKLLEGNDLELIEIALSQGLPLDKIVHFVQHPDFQEGIFKIIQMVENNFEKRVGLQELMYGQTAHAYRSAEEANVKQNQMSVRPDDMAKQVESAMTEGFRKMALMSRWHMTGMDLAKVFGQGIGQLWDQFVATAELDQVMNQVEYRIEAGSTRKPNRDREAQNANNAMTSLFPFLSQFAVSTGQVDQLNALLTMWGKALDLDVAGMLLPKPPPPPMPPPMADGQPYANGQANGKPQPQMVAA